MFQDSPEPPLATSFVLLSLLWSSTLWSAALPVSASEDVSKFETCSFATELKLSSSVCEDSSGLEESSVLTTGAAVVTSFGVVGAGVGAFVAGAGAERG